MNPAGPSVWKASILAAACIGFASFSLAQTAGSATPTAKSAESTTTYGTTSLTSYTMQSFMFEGNAGNSAFGSDGNGGRFPTSGTPVLDAPILLPAGAVIDHFVLEGCNTTPTSPLTAGLYKCTDGVCSFALSATVFSSSGCIRVGSTTGAEIVDNQLSSYFLEVGFGSLGGSTLLRSVRVYYKLQVSPGPAVATFADVPTTSPLFKFVEALASAGITAGCAGGNYCPGDPVTRGQMAVFLASALGLHFPN